MRKGNVILSWNKIGVGIALAVLKMKKRGEQDREGHIMAIIIARLLLDNKINGQR